MSMIYAGPECKRCRRPLIGVAEKGAKLCRECDEVERSVREAPDAMLADYLKAMAGSDCLHGMLGYQAAVREAARRLAERDATPGGGG